jgi:hypothetical protein
VNFVSQAKQYEDLLRPLGAAQRLSLVDRRELGDDRVYTYSVGYDTRTLRVQVGLAPDDRVSAFDVEPD